MTTPIDNGDDNERTIVRGKSGKGETDGSFGDGKAAAGAGVGFKLSVNKDKQVNSERRALVGNDLIDALVEFCSDGIARASANLTVVWNKSFALVNSFLRYCSKDLPKQTRALEHVATRDTRVPSQKKSPAFGMTLGPNGPTE